MTDLRQRLTRTLCAVFPELSKEEIPGASMRSTTGWDFESILAYLQGKINAKVA
jgi:hypothetical protein